MKKRSIVTALVGTMLFIYVSVMGFAQTIPEDNRGNAGQDLLQDPSWLVGATLQSIITQFGSPLAVYSVRGPESWQDDVVFSYDGIDLYWYQNRVWQIGLSQGYGIKKGDKKEAVLAILGEPLIQEESYLVFRLPSRGWPLRLRVSFSEQQVVKALFVYRPDY
jgi:hypothetical protein